MTFTDIHCHILPGIDDGASDENVTRQMLQMAYDEGIRVMVSTSHYVSAVGDDFWKRRKEALRKTASIAKEIGDDFRIVPGTEILYSEEALQELIEGKIWTLNGTKYVLVEFPTYVDFPYIRRALCNLQSHGFYPVVAHVERYEAIYSAERIEELINMGVLLQANAGSIIGKDGRQVKKFLLRLLKNRQLHMIGTDAHGTKTRRPLMKKCAHYIQKKTDEAYCREICRDNARKIIRREVIDA